MEKRLFIVLFLLMLSTGSGWAQAIPDSPEGRLWRLCKVWGYMKFYSPNTCQIKWDSLVNATIPLVQNAASNGEFNDRIMEMLNYVGQIPPALATPVPPADSNLNLQLDWTNDNVFSPGVRDFLDTFESRAGRNDSLECRIKLNDYTNPNFISLIDGRNDEINIPIQISDQKDRLTVLFQYWNNFNYFGPYRKLNDQNWDTTLWQAIPVIMTVTTSKDFQFAMIEAQSHIDDSHGGFYSAQFLDSMGDFHPPIYIDRVEDKPVVTRVYPGFAEVAVGDVLTKIDGIPVEDLVNVQRRYLATSNESTLYRDVYPRLLTGKNISKTFEFLDAAGLPYTKVLSFSKSGAAWWPWAEPAYSGPVWTTLCNGYGYVNMGVLMSDQVAQMYAELKDKEAIVLDVRNYPNGTIDELARLFFPEPVLTARYFQPDVTAPGRYSIRDDYGNLGSWTNPSPYTGKLYFLVNENTQSQAEYTVQYLSHVPGAKVVGSQTAGADGNIAYFSYRGGLTFYFTGLGWYYDDWYQCQRNGIKIDEIVTPTIHGIKEGKDEVLEHVSGCFSAVYGPEVVSLDASVYPNPATGNISVSISSRKEGPVVISISDILGNTLYKKKTDLIGTVMVKEDIDISSLSAGIYLLKVNAAGGGERTLKLIKR